MIQTPRHDFRSAQEQYDAITEVMRSLDGNGHLIGSTQGYWIGAERRTGSRAR